LRLPRLLAFKANLLLHCLINSAAYTRIFFFSCYHSFAYIGVPSILSFKTIEIIIFWCLMVRALSWWVMISLAPNFNLRFVVISKFIWVLMSILARSYTVCLEGCWYSNNWCIISMLFVGSHCFYIAMGRISIILWKRSIFCKLELRAWRRWQKLRINVYSLNLVIERVQWFLLEKMIHSSFVFFEFKLNN